MNYIDMSPEALNELQATLLDQYETLREAKLNLDLTRGKPAADQLDLANDMDGILDGFYMLQDGTDVRNYGGLLGIPEARALGGLFLDVPANQVMVGGNSSLTLMFQYIGSMMHGPWKDYESIKFLCPVPGYDRHFTICEHYGIEMINVPLNDEGPDVEAIQGLIAADPTIKGIWCVPKYSNPTGHTYSDKVVEQIAALGKVAGDDFRVMWDNAYTVHHLSDTPDTLKNIMEVAEAAGTEDTIVLIASTSKVTFAGAGISFVGLSETNLKLFEKYLSAATIGSDKVNQLRHVRFLKDAEGIDAHMKKHAAIIRPKFELTEEILAEHLGDTGVATWTKPAGGYFISLDTLPGLASKVVSMAGEIGVKLTPAGATFPYGKDPEDTNIRIAPTFPSIDALKQALEVFVLCVKLASVQKLLTEDG